MSINPADIIVGTIVAILIIFAVVQLVKRSKNGGSCCNCDGCNKSCTKKKGK